MHARRGQMLVHLRSCASKKGDDMGASPDRLACIKTAPRLAVTLNRLGAAIQGAPKKPYEAGGVLAGGSARPIRPGGEKRPISVLRFKDFRGFDSSRILNSRGGTPRPIGISPEILSQQILVGIILVGRLGVGSPGREMWRLPLCRRGRFAPEKNGHLLGPKPRISQLVIP